MALSCRFVSLEKWPRKPTPTYARKRAPFRAGYNDTLEKLEKLEKELSHLHGKNIVVQAYFKPSDIRNDGWPRSSARPQQPGVVLSFDSMHGALSLPCDHFDSWEDNMRAIAFHLEYLRKSGMYGVTSTGEQYTGWKKLPDNGNASGGFSTDEGAADFLSRHSGVDAASILRSYAWAQDAFRKAALAVHPDRGGDNADMALVNAAHSKLKIRFNQGGA